MPEPEGEDFKKAVSVLLPYLLSHRTRLATLEQRPDNDEEEAEEGAEAGAAKQEEQRESQSAALLSGLIAEQRAQLAEAVDTAILKVLTNSESSFITFGSKSMWPSLGPS